MKVLKGAEIFSTGLHNGIQFREQDLDAIANSFIALSLEGRVPLKLSHEGPDPREDLETRYALGWARRVWRDGNTLKADLEIPDKVAHAIGEGYLKFVSVELLKNVKADTRVLPWVLDAIALLGSDQPAVGTLQDLQALMTRAKSPVQLQGERRMVFKRDSHSSETSTMTDAEIAKLQSDLAAATKLAGDLKADFDRKETERVTKAAKANFKKATDMLDAAAKAEEILPAVGVRFFKFAARPESDTAFWAEFDVALVEECIKENTKPGAKKFGKKQAASGGENVDEGIDMDGMDESQKIAARVSKYCREHNIDVNDVAAYDAAIRTVFRADKKSAESYRSFACGESVQ